MSNNPGASSKDQKSLADQWQQYSSQLTPEQQALINFQATTGAATGDRRNQSTMEQLMIHQQWVYQQMMASYGNSGYPPQNGPFPNANGPPNPYPPPQNSNAYPPPQNSNQGGRMDNNNGSAYNRQGHERSSYGHQQQHNRNYRSHPYQNHSRDSRDRNARGDYHRDLNQSGNRSSNTPPPPPSDRPLPPPGQPRPLPPNDAKPKPPSHPHPPSNNKNIPAPRPPPPPQEIHRCDNCNKDFTNSITLQAHLSAHKPCPCCSFSALNARLKEHMAKEHPTANDDADEEKAAVKSSSFIPSDSPEDIAAWIEARRKRYPSGSKAQPEEKAHTIPEQEMPKPKKQHIPTSFKMCRFFIKGTCKLAEECPFQHSAPIQTDVSASLDSMLQSKSSSDQANALEKPQVLSADEELLLEAIKFICASGVFQK